jgi:hypothetical protein
MRPSASFQRALQALMLALLLQRAAIADPPGASPVLAPAPGGGEAASAEELDRPGEVENPFTLAPGTAQAVGYVLAANGQARENEDLGTGGGAVLLQTGVRLGLAPCLEGQVFADTYLNAIDRGTGGDGPGHADSGLGLLTLRMKVQVLANATGDYGLALVPFVRFPVSKALAGRTGAEPGLIVPFDIDLDHGWEIQGSTGVAFGHGDDGRRATDWETQASLEWHVAPGWSAYVEPELDTGEGRTRWALEQGITLLLRRGWQLDLGFNTGLGRDSGAHFGYVGLGVTF